MVARHLQRRLGPGWTLASIAAAFVSPGEDASLGNSGRIVRIADPEALGQASISLLSDTAEWQRAGQAAIRRVETYYTQPMMFDRYRALYQKGFNKEYPWQASASS